MAGSKKHLSRRERKFFVLKNAILKNWKISEGTSRREKCSMCFNAQRMLTKLFALFVLGLYFFFSLLGVNKEKKKYQEKEKSVQSIRICKNFSAQIFRHKTKKFASKIQQFYVTNQQLRCIICLWQIYIIPRLIILLLKLAGVHYGSLNHCLQSKQMQAFGLYAHKAHNCNEVAGQ